TGKWVPLVWGVGVAGGAGFEPALTGPKPVVLPITPPPILGCSLASRGDEPECNGASPGPALSPLAATLPSCGAPPPWRRGAPHFVEGVLGLTDIEEEPEAGGPGPG